MATMNVSLPGPMRDFVQHRIDTGQYASVSDYVRDLIRRDQGMAQDEARWLGELDASIARGLAEEAAGDVMGLDEVCTELRAQMTALSGKTSLP
jgi:antitoxin ParD1/3/4